MKFLLVSDVHVDMSTWSWTCMDNVPDDVNVAVIAGDVSNDVWETSRWLIDLKKRFNTVVWVAGNHDFYNIGFHQTRLHNPEWSAKWPDPCDVAEMYDHYQRWSDANGIIFLHRRGETIDGVRFVGATGWHDFRGGMPYSTEDQIKVWYEYINDTQIRWQKDLIRPDHLKPMEAGLRDWEALGHLVYSSDAPTVVITHHIPHRRFLWQKPHDRIWTMLHGSFVNTRMESIVDPRIKYWIYGHTHQRGMMNIDGTTYVCNAKGYYGENPSWEPVILEV